MYATKSAPLDADNQMLRKLNLHHELDYFMLVLVTRSGVYITGFDFNDENKFS